MSVVQVQQPSHCTNQRGFSRTIGAQQGNDATFGHLHMHVFQGQAFAVVGHAQTLNV
jgi:hypothetical protein